MIGHGDSREVHVDDVEHAGLGDAPHDAAGCDEKRLLHGLVNRNDHRDSGLHFRSALDAQRAVQRLHCITNHRQAITVACKLIGVVTRREPGLVQQRPQRVRRQFRVRVEESEGKALLPDAPPIDPSTVVDDRDFKVDIRLFRLDSDGAASRLGSTEACVDIFDAVDRGVDNELPDRITQTIENLPIDKNVVTHDLDVQLLARLPAEIPAKLRKRVRHVAEWSCSETERLALDPFASIGNRLDLARNVRNAV